MLNPFKKGRMGDGKLGLGPFYVTVSNYIAVILGYVAPVALRPFEHGHYSFVMRYL